jgi:hypothetical protein
LTNGIDRLGLIHEHAPPDGGIELAMFGGEPQEVALGEGDVREAARSLSRRRERACISVHAQHLTLSPTSRAIINETSPRPQPMSSTRMPAPMPASTSSRSVIDG